jgi:integrase/recombinase XerD
LTNEKGESPHTVEAYRGDLERFHLFLESSAYTKEKIVEFLADQRARKFAPSTVARRMIALKVFFKFLKREGVIPQNIALYLETPKQWKTLPEYLTEEEVTKLVSIEEETPEALRDKAILELLYSSGLRVSELCRLKIYDVDDLFVKVMGKGQKERVVPLGKPALEAIDRYLCEVRSQYDSESETTLFLTPKGKPITREYVWKRVKVRAKAVGIMKEISPHTLRHTYATHLLDHGADLRVIQEMLGHATIASTDRYTHVSRVRLQESFNACHPRK